MKQIVAAGDLRLTKSLGQNFLHDGNQLRRIIAAAELSKADKILEVGPGLGALTELLLKNTGEVLAVEKDARLLELLRKRFKPPSLPMNPLTPIGGEGGRRPGEGASGTDRLLLLHDDALKFLQRESRDWNDWKLVANLPYSVASPIVVELAQAKGCPERMVVTLQLEVARRLLARPGNEDYGLLTLLTQLRYEPRGWFKIPAGCFFPEPDVDSACVTLVRRPEALLSQEQAQTFTKIVKRAFSQRRKMMFKLLKEDWQAEKLAAAFGKAKLPSQARAETADLDQFVRLAQMLHL